MKILVDICHPAHVHLFKNMIWILQNNGDKIKINCRDKDVTVDLLNRVWSKILQEKRIRRWMRRWRQREKTQKK